MGFEIESHLSWPGFMAQAGHGGLNEKCSQGAPVFEHLVPGWECAVQGGGRALVGEVLDSGVDFESS